MNHHLLRDSHNLLAGVDMRGNLVAVAVLLVLGVIVLRVVSPIAETSTPRWWLVATAFFCGPAAALAWFAAEVLFFPSDYLGPKDYAESLLPILIIGIIGGTIGSAAIWVGECTNCCWGRKRSRYPKNGTDEQLRPLEPAAGSDSNGTSSPPAQ